MGTVFEAYDRHMKRRVALKVQSLQAAEPDKAAARFAREAWIAGRLSHSGLVKVYERGSWMDLSYYSMELMDGGSLHDVIKRMRQWGKDGSLAFTFGSHEYVAWAIAQVVSAARALDHVHREGIVHRDIKPMNLLLSKDPPALKITDFGIALDTEETRLTAVGGVIGTVAYMSPEQIRGRGDLVDRRSDIYALGVTLFELLTLELPYTGASRDAYASAVLTTTARRARRLNARVSRDLDVVVSKALEKSPADRYESCAAFADDLERVLAYKPILARPPSAPGRIVRWARRRPIHASLVAVLIVAGPSFSALGARAWRQAQELQRVEVDSLRDRARRLHQMERYRESLEPLSEILVREPDDVDAHRASAVSHWYVASEETDPARREEHRALAIEQVTAVMGLQPAASWPHKIRAFMLADFGRAEEAARDEAEALRLKSDPPTDEEVEVDALLALIAGRHAEAVVGFTEVLARRPGYAQARLNRARSYRDLGETTRARVDYEVAAGLMPADPVPLFNLGRILTQTGDLVEGEQRFRQAIERNPLNGIIREGLSENLVKQGMAAAATGSTDTAVARLQEAETEALEAIRLAPDLPGPHLNLGTSLLERSRLPGQPSQDLLARASASYDHLLELLRASPASRGSYLYGKAYASQCDVLIQSRSLDRALDVCRRAVETTPDDPVAHYNLAGAYALLGRRDDALEALAGDVALGDRDHAYLEADPWFETLRADPRFKGLLERMRRTPGS